MVVIRCGMDKVGTSCWTWAHITCLVLVLVGVCCTWRRGIGSIWDFGFWVLKSMLGSKASVGAAVKTAEGRIGAVQVRHAFGPTMDAFRLSMAGMRGHGWDVGTRCWRRCFVVNRLVMLFWMVVNRFNRMMMSRLRMVVSRFRMMMGRFNRLMVGRFNRMMVGRFNRMMVSRFNRLMVGRRPHSSCRLPMVRASSCLRVQNFFWQRGGVAHTVAVAEVPVVPFRLDEMF